MSVGRPEKWIPETGETFFYCTPLYFDIKEEKYDPERHERYSRTGNCFHTYQEADEFLQRVGHK